MDENSYLQRFSETNDANKEHGNNTITTHIKDLMEVNECQEYETNSAPVTLQLRVTGNWNCFTPYSVLEIIGDGLEWECRLEDYERKTLDMKWHFYQIKRKDLGCLLCEWNVSASGECGCSGMFHEFSYDPMLIAQNRNLFLKIINLCINTGIPSPSELPQDKPFYWRSENPNTYLQEVQFARNGVVIRFLAWFAYNTTHESNLICSDATASSESESKVENLNSFMPYTVHVRLKYFGEGVFPLTLEIVGDRLDWQRMWKDVMLNIARLSWHFYPLPQEWALSPEDFYQDSVDSEDYMEEEFDDESYEEEPLPAAKSAVEKLATFTMETRGVFCSICQEIIVIGEKTIHLPCDHVYHAECIVKWLGVRNFCPVCKYEFPTTEDPDSREERGTNSTLFSR
ncbi:hypothetical protein SUGI_0296990 [Cryptomeria japonica]|nr:hypothetical protein SUGI_0296990 [Cryptomeria japonica]